MIETNTLWLYLGGRVQNIRSVFMVKNKIPIEWNLLLIIKIAPGR